VIAVLGARNPRTVLDYQYPFQVSSGLSLRFFIKFLLKEIIMARVTTTILPPPVQVHYDRVLLSMSDPNLIHSKVAMKKNLAARSGNIIRMERYDDIGTAPVPLGNSGITPPSKLMSSIFVDAQINWYGKVCAVVKSSLIDLEAEVVFN